MTSATEARAQSAATFLGELMDLTQAFDGQLARIDMHGNDIPVSDWLMPWPTEYDIASGIGAVEYGLGEGLGPSVFIGTQDIALITALKRLEYLMGLYTKADHPGDLAYYAYAAGQARDEIAVSTQVLITELREWIKQ